MERLIEAIIKAIRNKMRKVPGDGIGAALWNLILNAFTIVPMLVIMVKALAFWLKNMFFSQNFSLTKSNLFWAAIIVAIIVATIISRRIFWLIYDGVHHVIIRRR